MTVYVDELVSYAQAAQGGALGNKHFGNGKQSCHMTADTPEELHALAGRLGLKRSWAQSEGRDTLHYDLTPTKRGQALKLGAVFKDARTQARERIDARRAARIEQPEQLQPPKAEQQPFDWD